MSEHAYPVRVALADGARAGVGVVLVGAPLVLVKTAAPIAALLAASALVFILHAVRAASRHWIRIEVDDAGIRTRGSATRAVRWRDVQRVRLSYYSTRRDRSGGWLQLTVIGVHHRRLDVDSRLAGFERVAAHAAAAARRNGLTLDAATRFNFQALGLPVGDPGAERDAS